MNYTLGLLPIIYALIVWSSNKSWISSKFEPWKTVISLFFHFAIWNTISSHSFCILTIAFSNRCSFYAPSEITSIKSTNYSTRYLTNSLTVIWDGSNDIFISFSIPSQCRFSIPYFVNISTIGTNLLRCYKSSLNSLITLKAKVSGLKLFHKFSVVFWYFFKLPSRLFGSILINGSVITYFLRSMKEAKFNKL